MDLNQYRGNSNASKQQTIVNDIPDRASIQQITTGKKVEKTAGSKLMSDFIAEDIHNIKEYLWNEVVVPSIKNLISDGVSNFIDMLLFGQTRGGRTAFGLSNSVKRITPYSSLYSTNNVSGNRVVKYNDIQPERPRGLDRYSCQDILIEFSPNESPNDTKNRATYVLTRMRMYLNEYGMVAVADLYDAVGIVPDKEDNHWGWRDLSRASIQSCRDGYLIRMPAVEPIN